MRLPPSLREPFRSTYAKIFEAPAEEPLEWRDVRALFREIGEAAWEANGDLKVMRNGHVLLLRPPPTRYVSGADELLELRRFLERSEDVFSVPEPADEPHPQPPSRGGEAPSGSDD